MFGAPLVNLLRNLRDVALVRNPPPRAPLPDGCVLDGAHPDVEPGRFTAVRRRACEELDASRSRVDRSLLSPQSVAPPPTRRVHARLPVGLREDSYSVGVHTGNLGRGQVALDGAPAVDLLCWEHLKRRPCTCDDALAHVADSPARAQLCFGALGTGNGRHRGADCPWPHPENVLEELACGARARRTAGGDHAAGANRRLATEPLCAHRLRLTPAAPVHGAGVRRARAPHAPRRRRSDDRPPTAGRAVERRGARVRRDAPPAPAARLRQGDLRGVCRRRRCGTLAPAAAAGGSGLTILDVCSGSGLGAAVLSRVWPEARVVMLDSNREMDLTHVFGAPKPRLYRARSLRQKRGRGAERRLGGRGHASSSASTSAARCHRADHALRARRGRRRASECRPAASRARSASLSGAAPPTTRSTSRRAASTPRRSRASADRELDGRRRRPAPTRRRHASRGMACRRSAELRLSP